MRHFRYADAALSYVEELEAVRSRADLLEATRHTLKMFGFSHFIISAIPLTGDTVEEGILLDDWPRDWLAVYLRDNYAGADPVARFARQASSPFNWSDAPYDRATNPRAGEVMARACEFGLYDGVCVPWRCASGDLCLSMSGSRADLSARAKPALHFIALHAIDVALQIAGSRF